MFIKIIHSDNLFQKALNKRGTEKQLLQCCQENGELTHAILKSIQTGAANRTNIIEEIADVEIALNYPKMVFQITEAELEDIKVLKLKRLERLLE